MTTADTLLDPMPNSELMGYSLDMGRPELADVMRRYSSDARGTLNSPLHAPAALIVTRKAGEEASLKGAFEHDGWFVKTCAGPGAGSCPVMRGERCPLRESVDAAVVFVDPRDVYGRLGAVPRLRCAADSSSPGVVALEGRFDPPTFADASATVGALGGPKGVLSAVSALLVSLTTTKSIRGKDTARRSNRGEP